MSYGLHFTDGETKAQWGQVTCSRLHTASKQHGHNSDLGLHYFKANVFSISHKWHSLAANIFLASPVEITPCYTWVRTDSAQSSYSRKPGTYELTPDAWKTFVPEGKDQVRKKARNSTG